MPPNRNALTIPYVSAAEVNAFCEKYISKPLRISDGGWGHDWERYQPEPTALAAWGGDSSEEYDRKWGFR